MILRNSLLLIMMLALSACQGKSDELDSTEDLTASTLFSEAGDRSGSAQIGSQVVGQSNAEPGFAGSPNGPEVSTSSEVVSLSENPGVEVAPVSRPVGAASITDVVLVTGQSNALGSETAYDPVLDAPVDRFYAYTQYDGWQPATLRQVWDLDWHPYKGLGDDPHNNFGFHFGKSLVQQRDNRVVGIILATAPGEGISHWDGDSEFFNEIRNKALLALNALPQKSGIDGILWHQGETDWSRAGSNDPDLEDFPANDYYSNKLWNLINNFRSETWFDVERPFICGETARSPINDRLNALNRNRDIWTACVPGAGLETWDEAEVHFTAGALRELGSNYADVYLQMTDPQ